MRPDRAWVRLQSSIGLDLLDPNMAAWEDRDLAKATTTCCTSADRLAAAR